MNFQSGKFFRADQGGELDREIGIFVEGKDDAHLIDALLVELGANPLRVRLVFSGGVDVIRTDIANLVKSRQYVTRVVRTIIVIRDADEDAKKTLVDAQDAMALSGLPKPSQGEIIEYDGDRKIGVYILPSIEESGAIEELLLKTVVADEVYSIVDTSFSQIDDLRGGLPKAAKRKAQMFLAGADPLCRGAGVAAKAGHFDLTHESMTELRDFLSKVIA